MRKIYPEIKKLLCPLVFLFVVTSVTAQNKLYEYRGVTITYTNTTLKQAYCSKDNVTVYFVTANFQISNNSGVPVYVRFGMNMQANLPYIGCYDDDVIHFFYQPHNSIVDGVLQPGQSVEGEDGNWFLGPNVVPWWALHDLRFGPSPNTNPPVNTAANRPVNNPPIAAYKPAVNKKPVTGIYQNDVIVNPKPQPNYAQQQKQSDAATANAMKTWQNNYKQNQDQLTAMNNLNKNSQAQFEQKQQLQQQANAQRQEQASAKLNALQQQYVQQQQQSQQFQADLDNAKNASMSAYTNAINSGASGSSAMVDATLAGASQIGNGKAALVYTGVGLGLSLFMHLSEKKAAEQQKQADEQAEQERKNLIITTKNQFVKEALDINQYSFADLVAKDRYAAILLTPKNFSAGEDPVYFTYPIEVPKYSDDTYPLKPELERSLLLALDKSLLVGNDVYILYPITNTDQFSNDFIKKMGSGKVISLNANLVNFVNYPFTNVSQQDDDKDFWGEPVKKTIVKETTAKKSPAPAAKTEQKKDNSFWDN